MAVQGVSPVRSTHTSALLWPSPALDRNYVPLPHPTSTRCCSYKVASKEKGFHQHPPTFVTYTPGEDEAQQVWRDARCAGACCAVPPNALRCAGMCSCMLPR